MRIGSSVALADLGYLAREGRLPLETAAGDEVTGTAAGVIALLGEGTGAHGAVGQGSGAISIIGSAEGAHGVVGSGAAVISLFGSGQGALGVSGEAAGTFQLVGAGVGEVDSAASPSPSFLVGGFALPRRRRRKVEPQPVELAAVVGEGHGVVQFVGSGLGEAMPESEEDELLLILGLVS